MSTVQELQSSGHLVVVAPPGAPSMHPRKHCWGLGCESWWFRPSRTSGTAPDRCTRRCVSCKEKCQRVSPQALFGCLTECMRMSGVSTVSLLPRNMFCGVMCDCHAWLKGGCRQRHAALWMISLAWIPTLSTTPDSGPHCSVHSSCQWDDWRRTPAADVLPLIRVLCLTGCHPASACLACLWL